MSTIQTVREFLEARKAGFIQSLRTRGLDQPSASFLRHSVRTLGDAALAMDSEGLPTDGDDESDMTITRTITTPSVDRYGDVVNSRGCEKALKKYFPDNPQVFFAHKSTDLPIATTVDLRVFDDRIVAKARFHEETEEARCVWRMRKILKATSIGFLPCKASIIGSNKDEDELLEERVRKRKEKTPDGEKVIDFEPWMALRFLEWELLEWSVVSIPANPDCVESLSKWLRDGVVEGEKIPLSLKKSLEPHARKGRVWVHGYDPEKEGHTGPVVLGGHELEFDAGKIVKVDGCAFQPPEAPAPTKSLEKRPLKGLLFKDVKAGKQDPANPMVLAVPDMAQINHFSCGLYATWEVGKFFGVGPDSYDEWQKLLGTSVEESTHPEKIVEVLSDLGLTVEARQHMTYEDLVAQWKAGHPVICPVQDYGVFVPKEAKFPYGHYLVVIAACLDKVIVQDSSSDNVLRGSESIQEDGRVLIDRAKWEENWVDVDVDGNKYNHYGIIVCQDSDIPPPVDLVKMAREFLK